MGPNFQWDDDSDHGVPILQVPSRTRAQRLRITYLRYRLPVFILGGIIFLLYWTKGTEHETTDWSRFAYAQYATDTHTLCNSVMIFDSLHRLDSKASRVLLYPQAWDAKQKNSKDRNVQLLQLAQKKYGVKLEPVQLLSVDGAGEPGTMATPSGYQSSLTKFRLFELEQYDRVLYFDGDSILRQHMDELFSLPHVAVAMPRAYWTADKPRDQWPLSSSLMVIQPNVAETKHMWETLQWWRLNPQHATSQHYDDQLINDRFGASALVLPHRPYLLQTSEFRGEDHAAWLGSYGAPASAVKWNPTIAHREAKLIHFSDWPLPKPWIMWPNDGLLEMQPSCFGSHVASCDEREIWKSLYDEFRWRRKNVCKLLSAPAPQNWQEWKNRTGAL